MADKIAAHELAVGSLVAPVWPGIVGGSAMGSEQDRANFVLAVKKACRIAGLLNKHGVRKYGIIRIDSADSPAHWDADQKGNTKKIAATFREAAKVAADHGERLAAEGEICWADLPEPAGSGPGFRRPVAVVRSHAINRSRIATVVWGTCLFLRGRQHCPKILW